MNYAKFESLCKTKHGNKQIVSKCCQTLTLVNRGIMLVNQSRMVYYALFWGFVIFQIMKKIELKIIPELTHTKKIIDQRMHFVSGDSFDHPHWLIRSILEITQQHQVHKLWKQDLLDCRTYGTIRKCFALKLPRSKIYFLVPRRLL